MIEEILEVSQPVEGTDGEKYLQTRLPGGDVSMFPDYSVRWIPGDAEIVFHQDMKSPPSDVTSIICYLFYKPDDLLSRSNITPASVELEGLAGCKFPNKRWRKTYGDAAGSVCEMAVLSNRTDMLCLAEGALSCAAALFMMLRNEKIMPDRAWGYGWAQNAHKADLSVWDRITLAADGDKAGRQAAQRIAAKYETEIEQMPDGLDPVDMYAKTL